MSPKKTTQKQTVKPHQVKAEAPVSSGIRWGESYVSLLLGALVVVVAAALGFFYVKLQQPKQELLPPAVTSRNVKLTVTPEQSATQSAQTMPTGKQRTYTVQKGDNLWSIAEKIYGSGYNWISISRANNLVNPGVIHSGNVLVIPSVTPILIKNEQPVSPTITPTRKVTPTLSPKPTATPTAVPTPVISQANPITAAKYIVKPGDSLWSIAIRAYGNGDRWVDIAQANHLTNPSVIHSGNVLIIPRKQTL